jgi:hypothetical protein
MVEAAGTYAELHASGLDLAKQLGLEIETEDSQEKHRSISHIDSKHSLCKTKRQNSETSEHVSLFTA